MTEAEGKLSLRSRLAARQQQLRAVLAEAGCEGHPTTSGDISEGAWRSMLRNFLPRRYEVGTGFVVDSKGGISEQQDVILYDRHYSPALLSTSEPDQPAYVTVESVYAVLEVKPTLNKTNTIAAAAKAASVRQLHRTLASLVQTAHGRQEAAPHAPILAGLLTATCQWSTRNVQDALDGALRDAAAE